VEKDVLQTFSGVLPLRLAGTVTPRLISLVRYIIRVGLCRSIQPRISFLLVNESEKKIRLLMKIIILNKGFNHLLTMEECGCLESEAY